MRKLLWLAIALSATAFADDIGITAFTMPSGYIKKFPLNQITQAELMSALGVPAKEMQFQGKTLWSYQYGEPGEIGTYTFTIEGDVVTEVNYVNQKGRRASSKKD